MKKIKIFRNILPDNPKKWKIFSVCMGIASLFWLFLTFSKSFEHPLVFSIKYQGQPLNKMLVNEPVTQVKVLVRAKGFDLFRYTLLDKKKSVTLDLNNFSVSKNGSLTQYGLHLSNNENTLFAKKSSELKAISCSVDTLKLTFDEILSKRILVVPRVNLETDSALFFVENTQLLVDTVTVKGSKTALERLDTIFTTQHDISQLQNSQQIMLAIEKPKGVSLVSPDSVALKLAVAAIEQHEMSVPISCKDCPDSIKVKLFPSIAQISFGCTKKEFLALKPSDFLLNVDHAEIEKGAEKLFIKLIQFPSQARELKLSPAKAEYLVSKNNGG